MFATKIDVNQEPSKRVSVTEASGLDYCGSVTADPSPDCKVYGGADRFVVDLDLRSPST